MRTISQSKKFEKDVKRCRKRGYDLTRLKEVMTLVANDALENKHRPHILSGNYANYWECHIRPDWLLIYLLTEDNVTFERTGTHADLFD